MISELCREYSDTTENELLDKLVDFSERLSERLSLWEDRISNHLRKIEIVKIALNTQLNPEKIVLGAKSFFEEDIWDDMEELEKMDLDDGCKCISIQAWTPAGMIIMRAIEKAIRNYYQKITRNDPTNKTWGNLLSELETNPSANVDLLGYFNYLRKIRNTIQHPDKRLNQTETESFFMQAVHIFTIIHS